jgi:NAD(P)-dependent dehydrogenase (short-subunit alcohol dehydrogenase family)
MTTELAGKVAIVTGGGRGIGRAVARRFAEAGAAVCVTARSQDEIDETVRLIGVAGGRAIAVTGDVSDPDDVERVVSTARERLGPIGILVSNAGQSGPYVPIRYADPATWWRTVEVHLRGAFLYSHAVLDGMAEAGGGRIVVVASRSGVMVTPNISAYGVAKSAQIRFAEYLAAEGKEHNVVAFSIWPGTIFTNIGESVIEDEGAQRWVPEMVARWRELKATSNPEEALERCATMCLELVSGRCDALSGRYLTPNDDLAALVREASRD